MIQAGRLHQRRAEAARQPSAIRIGSNALIPLLRHSSIRLQARRVAEIEPVPGQQEDGVGAKPLENCTTPVARIVPRRSVVYEDAGMHRPLGLVLFGAYVLGSASSLAGTTEPLWLPTLTGAAIGLATAIAHRYCIARLWRPPTTPLNVLISGGTRGLGKALAREFLTHGDSVIITGRTPAALSTAISTLTNELQGLGIQDLPKIRGVVCDVTEPDQVSALAVQAKTLLGSVDVWICNAGYSGSYKNFLDLDPASIATVVKTNLLGTLLCSRQAAKVMLQQELGGHIFIMDGAGADGSATPQYAAYGATKAAFPQLAASLNAELASTHVGVHVLSPGMMLTELLLENATSANKQAFNILCEHPETVAAFLVPRVRSAVSCGLNGTYTKYLTPASAIYRLLTSPWRIGRFFDSQGNPVYAPEHERILGKGAKATARRQAIARARTSSLGVVYSLSLALSFVVLSLDTHASAFTGH